MASCPACGSATGEGDRYCSACGTALIGSIGSDEADLPSRSDEVELLTVGGPQPDALRHDPAPDGPGAPQARRAVALVAAAAALALAGGLGAWAVGWAGGGSSDASQPDTTASTAEAPGSTATTVEGGPVLGRPVGWSLLLGDTNETALRRFDLDSGESTDVPGDGGWPLLLTDDHLVLERFDDISGSTMLAIVPADDPAGAGIEIDAGDRQFGVSWPVVPGPDGDIWIYHAGPDDTSWRLIHPSDGTVVEEVAAGAVTLALPVDRGGPDVVSSPGGGVYRRDGDDYRLLSPGSPVTVSRGAVLISICSDPTACRLDWLDIDTGRPVDGPLPADGGVRWVGLVGGSERYLIGVRWADIASFEDTEFMVFDLERGNLLASEGRTTGGRTASSPDGRFLAVQSDTGIDLYDADHERWVTIHPGGQASGGLLFVKNGPS